MTNMFVFDMLRRVVDTAMAKTLFLRVTSMRPGAVEREIIEASNINSRTILMSSPDFN